MARVAFCRAKERYLSFRGRLRLFFTSIVIVPMIAVALVLFTLTGESETGKADAGIAAGLRSALSVYDGLRDRAEPALAAIAMDRRMREALVRGRARQAQARMEQLVRAQPRLASIELYDDSGRLVAQAGSPEAIAAKNRRLAVRDGQPLGMLLSVSVTRAPEYVRAVEDLKGFQVSVFRGGRRVPTTV